MRADFAEEPLRAVASLPDAELPHVSVIVPCRNERLHIAACLDSILGLDYPADLLDVIIADGESDDGTRPILDAYSARHSRIRWLENPRRSTPAALNIAIRSARGDVIVRMDVHCRYPTNYVRRLVSWLELSGADNVGGVCHTRPANAAPLARAIALALADPFGVGNSYFRIGTTEPRWVDTVPFGCYRRAVFDRIGLFDEDLIRNQDDELNHRLHAMGGRILLVPDVVCDYFARDSFRQLALMYYQYGYFKPLVARKLGRVMTARQLVPPLFVATLAVTLALVPFHPLGGVAFPVVAGAYLTALLIRVIVVTPRGERRLAACLTGAFPTMHFSYGWGFLRGVVDVSRPAPRRQRSGSVPLSR